MDEELKKRLKKIERRLDAIESYLQQLPAFEKEEDHGDALDEFYEQAQWIVLEHGKASPAMLQRHLQIGYNRAARLMDQLEENGIIGPAKGSETRDVLVTKEDLKELSTLLEKKEEKKKVN